jgi:hypothetical protein
MVTNGSTLGDCPTCETEIPAGLLLIEYETADGRAVYAECPSCVEPVHPR